MTVWFNRKKYGIPFGKFSSSNYSEFPSNEVLVGREGSSRADLIEFLIDTGPQGSFLVTGRRGVGKTNFVDYCLREYERSIFKRFLRSNLGRSFSELFMLLLIPIVGIYLVLCYSQLAPIIVQNLKQNPLLVVLVSPIIISVFWLCTYARNTFLVIIKYQGIKYKKAIPAGIFSILLIVILFGYLLYFPMHSSPSSVLSRLLILTCNAYIIFQIPCFLKPKDTCSKLFNIFGIVINSLGVVWFLLLLDQFLNPWRFFRIFPDGFGVSENLLLSSELILIGLTVRYADLITKIIAIDKGVHQKSDISKEGVIKGLHWIAALIAIFCVLFASFMYWNCSAINHDFITYHTWFCLISAVLSTIYSYHLIPRKINNTSNERLGVTEYLKQFLKKSLQSLLEPTPNFEWLSQFQPESIPILKKLPQFKSEAILILKALCFLLIAFQISTPLLSELFTTFNIPDFLGIRGVITTSKSINSGGQYIWFGIMSVLLFSIYYIEYEWIVRPGIIAREDNALSPGAQPGWSDHIVDTDTDTDTGKDKDKETTPDKRAWLRWYYLEQERLSLPYLTYAIWMPTLITTINLGFDSLDQKRVIQAMLVGLRQKYYDLFLSWSSVRANLKRFVSLSGILVIVLVISNVFFDIPINGPIKISASSQQEKWTDKIKSDSEKSANKNDQIAIIKYSPKFKVEPGRNYCLYEILVANRSTYPSIPRLLCSFSNDFGNIAISVLYFEVLPVYIKDKESDNQLLFSVFHLNRAFPQKLTKNEEYQPGKPLQYSSLSLRIYHLLLFFLVVSLFRWISIKSPLFSHKRNIQQIDDLLDSLTGRVSRTKNRELSKPAKWVQSIFIDSESRTFEQEKSDPRTIELAFLSILNDIRYTSNVFPLAFSRRMYTQAIEVTFVFDELDKLSAHSGERNKNYGTVSNDKSDQQRETNEYQLNQRRNDSMQHLLSDMKRILSSAPARFIFVGGRQLYDQWLADGTKKQPLLTSIFNGQINLKSLLVHHDNHWTEESAKTPGLSDKTTFHSRIEEYLYLQHYYSKKRYKDWYGKQWVPFFGLHDDPQIEADFSQWTFDIAEIDFHRKIKFMSCEDLSSDTKCNLEPNQHLSKFYIESFIHFLTYRSAGNPKKLKELLATFVQPASRVIRTRETREHNFSEQDVLSLDSLQVLRIELISSIYEHLRSGFERQLITRDDKIVEALFYLTDFLFKFHSRAFSWDSLERIDELDHVHRPPDLHLILEKLVDHNSETFMHKIFNGMYSFRFRSDMTKEIEFLSRYSSEEMAAFNFTLDESQALKQSYKRALGATDIINPDLVSGLGALYEYDQDFESARHNYRRAIRLLDERLQYVVGSEVKLKETEQDKISLLKAIYSGQLSGQKNAAIDLSWGGTRLRIMLKIGLTYERTKNYERAILQYRQCLALSNVLIDAYLIKLPSELSLEPENVMRLDDNICEHSQVLKHLNIIFQSIFASAWGSEKWFGGIDSGTSIIEKELRSLRNRLPFVKKIDITNNEETVKEIVGIGNAYYSVIMSQLHNKAGDLYFFKGIQNIEYGGINRKDYNDFNNTGYLLNAHHHYAVSLHEMRRYIYYRKCRVENKSNFPQDSAKKTQPIAEGCWPNYQTLGVSEGLSDLSESTLALASGWLLLEEISINHNENILLQKFDDKFKQRISKKIIKWFEMSDDDTSPQRCNISIQIKTDPKGLPLKDWFGTWTNNSIDITSLFEPQERVIDFEGPNSLQDRFLMSLYLSIASADLRENAGYLENAAREYLQICDTIAQYFWWFCSIGQLEKTKLKNKIKDKHYLLHCLSISVWILEYIDKLYRLARKTQDQGKYKIGKTIPPSALMLACSLCIVSRVIFPDCDSLHYKDKWSFQLLWNRLTKLIVEWRGENFKKEDLQIVPVKDDKEKQKIIQKFESQKKECTILIVYLQNDSSKLTIAGFNGGGVYNKVSHSATRSELSVEVKKWIKIKSIITNLAASELGFTSFKDRSQGTIEEFQTILKNSICIHKYPVLNQLNTLKLLIDTAIFKPYEFNQKDCSGWVEELHELNSRYNSPLHFTPNMIGITYASFWMKCKESQESINSLHFDLESEILRSFRTSREMYTMGRSYYTAIDNLYYLYDDFNDRLIHRNHAMQMASAELVRQYEKVIKNGMKF